MKLRSWFSASMFLLVLLFPAAGCGNAAVHPKVLQKCDDAIHLEGYMNGFNSGAAEGYQDNAKDEGYSPSLKKVISGGYRYSTGYWRGYVEGYDFGWSTPRGGEPKKKGEWYMLAVEQSKGGGGKGPTGYGANVGDYNDGYASGFMQGKKNAKADSKKGMDHYSETPSESAIDSFCEGKSKDFREGWIAGYKEGYSKNFQVTMVPEYDSGYEDGYKKGFNTGELDKKAGYSYNDTISAYDLIGSEEYQRGFKDGYKKGYEVGYSGS